MIELEEQEDLPKKAKVIKILKLIILVSGLFILAANFALWKIITLNNPPLEFPDSKQIVIEQGTDVREITEILESENIVKSKNLLYYIIVLLHEPTNIMASTYVFEEPITTTEVAKRLVVGDFDTDLVRFTHFEGERVRQIADRAESVLENFSAEEFIKAAEPLEGRLFPETYFIPPSFTDEEMLTLMTDTFDDNLIEYNSRIQEHSLSLDEILVLASIIEREANSTESKKAVSSVLQNRMEIGMALQADASIEYILDKPLSELTPKDLEIDSPYNTYLYTGLPPTPIGNPGLDAIVAVLEPTESDYFYYITDNEGVFHYAKTYNQHLINIDRYLK